MRGSASTMNTYFPSTMVKAQFGCSISVKSWQLTLAHLKYGAAMGPLFGWSACSDFRIALSSLAAGKAGIAHFSYDQHV
jgi:hypothetical protein